MHRICGYYNGSMRAVDYSLALPPRGGARGGNVTGFLARMPFIPAARSWTCQPMPGDGEATYLCLQHCPVMSPLSAERQVRLMTYMFHVAT